jgi:putative hemolysin
MMATSTLIFLLVGCVIMQAFFVSAEVALSAADRNRLRGRAAGGNVAAVRAERMLGVPQVTLATTLVGANLALLFAVIGVAIELVDRGYSPLLAPALAVPPLLVLGHLVPKAIVQIQADKVVDSLATWLRLASFVLRPIVFVVGGYAALVTRLTRTDRKKAFVTRDELAMLIESEPETDKPEISADEREMIANVFELSEYTVSDLMVPLSEVTAVPDDTTLGEAALEVADKQHSRMPVYHSRVDDIVGIVHAFDILAAGPDGQRRPVSEIAHGANYVPGSMKAIDLLVQLQAAGNPMAIVVDEYGGAVGVVTIEDLLETIVGDIDDEYDDEPSPIRQERPGVWRVEAKTSVAKLNQGLDIGLPESDDYETVAGLLIERFRRIPARGATLQVGGALIEVVEATDRAIEAVRISKRRR